ncbi:MAG: hypothetical protein HZC43_00680 [Nitrosomonadales bacterium]|nr:hypothetical protein [Nitrosomonadales bacterium]
MKTMINTERLLNLAKRHDWHYGALCLLLRASGIREKQEGIIHPITDEEVGAIPETLAYDAIKQYGYLDGTDLLDIAESVHGVDPLKSGGYLLWMLAHKFFIPLIPKDHPGYMESLLLLRVFKAYIDGAAKAEAYISAAYRYRTTFCNVWGNKADPEYEHLFEAMPGGGLEIAIALGGWGLKSTWDCLGRHLARSQPAFELLEELHEGIDETIFVEGDVTRDGYATEAAHQLIDEQMGYLREAALEPFEDRLREIVDAFLCGVPVQSAEKNVNG